MRLVPLVTLPVLLAVLVVILKYICQATIPTTMTWQARYFLSPMAEAAVLNLFLLEAVAEEAEEQVL